MSTIVIGGWPISFADSQTLHHYSLVVYDFDSIVWCVRRAALIPTWKNICQIFKRDSLEILLVGALMYYTTITFTYFFLFFEDKNWDSYRIMLAVLANIINMPSQLYIRNSVIRGAHFSLLFISLLVYIHFISFYSIVINTNYYEYQINSWSSIEMENLKLVIDDHRLLSIKNGRVNI